VNITYEDDVNSAPSKRYIQVYAKGVLQHQEILKVRHLLVTERLEISDCWWFKKTGSAKWKILGLIK
jgi:hypothetical protein